MKYSRILFLASLGFLLSFCLLGCKKDKTTESKIAHKWFVKKMEIKTIQEGHNSTINYPVTDGDYYTFKSDNTFIRSVDGTVISGIYTVINDERLVINADTADILKLTKDEFNLKVRSIGLNVITETEWNLEKK